MTLVLRRLSPLIRAQAVVGSRQRALAQISPRCLAFGPSRQLRAKSDDNVKSFDDEEGQAEALRKQEERPWHRAGSEGDKPDEATPPTDQDRRRGRLLTTPTRLLKLILPLPYHVDRQKHKEAIAAGDNETSSDEIQPLALLVHPQQPLSYLERLLQAEIPPIKIDGNERIPNIWFRAEADQSEDQGGRAGKKKNADEDEDGEGKDEDSIENEKKEADSAIAKDQQQGDNVASYSGLGHEGPKRDKKPNWVRWSGSTEVGDFIRDAARGREFAVDIEGYDQELRVAVPSFNDRTYYLRVRLRKASRRVDSLAKIKSDCDELAHRGAHRLAKGGFGLMAGWWGTVYYVTFHTDFGWDFVEPVTYLAGLTTIMGGYLWFLYISRDLSYKAALNITVSRRQQALYQARGFDAAKWEQLVHEANGLRREVRVVADEYDVEWDETRDLGGKEVKKVLEREEKKTRKGKGSKEEDEEEAKEHHKEEEAKAKKESKGDRGKEEDKSS